MNSLISLRRLTVMAVALLALAALPFAEAEQPLGAMKVKSLILTFNDDDLARVYVTGTAPELGRTACYGEIVFVAGEDRGSLNGLGVVAFTAANGDILVGVIAAQVSEGNSFSAEFHWRDAVTFGDGTTVSSTGRFAQHRPRGLRAGWDQVSNHD